MPLQSELFRDDTALQACLVKDTAHIVKGARGAHVEKIQTALGIIEGALIDSDELAASAYGPSTAAAVLAYKRKRDIVNRTYQQRADDIVGKKVDRDAQPPERAFPGRSGAQRLALHEPR